MQFVSTSENAPPAPLVEALFRSLAPDGGLYVPERLEPFSVPEVRELTAAPLVEGGARLLARLGLADTVEHETIEELVASTLCFPLPLRLLDDGTAPEGSTIGSLELFWGPTLAFKDVGARFMARLMAKLRPEAAARGLASDDAPLTILAATSGDTGSAVAQAFHGLEGFRVAVLFPAGQVSEAQQRLFTTLGDNVVSLRVAGTFDDCQRLVKRAFADSELRRRAPLASANSISVGRLLPQTLYYLELCRQLRQNDETRPLWVSTPSGNFGNLTAGLYARRLGLPIDRFVAATNRNDVVPEFLAGAPFRPRPSVRTPSNAMDVGDPSNFRRIEALYGGDTQAMRSDLVGRKFDDEATLAAIRDVHRRIGLVLDPHAAVGYLGLREELSATAVASGTGTDVQGVFLATAHPAKFADVVAEATGEAPELPEALSRCFERPEAITDLEADYDALRDALLAL